MTIQLAERSVVLFDFDGTVVDTQGAILRVASRVLVEHGYPEPRTEELLPIVGPPLEEGFALVTGADRDEALALTAAYRELFHEIVTPADCPPLPGMRSLLDALSASRRSLAVATSRMEETARDMVREQGLTQFRAVCGRVPGVRYSKAESIAAALDALGANAAEAVMVGDRKHDVEGARELGVPCIGLYSGAAEPGEHERAGAAAIAHDAAELARLLGV